MAEKVAGLQLDSQTRVADFVLANDRVLTRTAYFLKGLRFTDAKYDEKTAAVDAELTIRELVEFLKEIQKKELKDGKWSEVKFTSQDVKNVDTVLSTTGKGAITDEMATSKPSAQEGTVAEEKEIIKTVITRRVLRQEIGVE
jgi:iron only hydrogenase large subunit-like protein